jgi:DNA replication protein DnaC
VGGSGGDLGRHEPCDQIVANRGVVGQPHQRRIPPLDLHLPEQRRHQSGRVLGVEAGRPWPPHLRQLRRVVTAGRGGKEGSSQGEDTVSLADGGGRLGQVVEHVDGHRGVEGVGQERQGGGVGLDHRQRMGAQHGGRGVQPDDPRSQRIGQRRSESAFPTADVQDALRFDPGQHLSDELVQAARRRQRRIHDARFPRVKRLDGFDLAAAPGVNPATLAALASCAWIDHGQPLVLLGDSGTGKSHLLIGAGIAACEQGRSVRYVTTAALVNELVEAADERTLAKTIGRYGRLDLLCCDELGYLHLDPRGAELLFQVITEREEKASIAVASNAPFGEWGQTFTDPRLAAAVVDRLTFNALIIQTGTDSYRLRATRRAKKGSATT